jgi:catecholate siderophore receptor
MASTAAVGGHAYAQGQPGATDGQGAAASAEGITVGSAQPMRFEILPGTVGSVMEWFNALTGIRIELASEMLRDLPSPGVTGVMTPEQALEQALMGTGVAFTPTGRSSVTLDIRRSEFVTVTGGEPTVSSPKYATRIREIPQTVAIIPRAIIAEQGATTLSEALRNVPGITLQAGEGGGASNTAGDMFNMRGFNASNSLFVDGVRDDGLVSRDVFNLEQVEVFMGPTGSDVGRGTAAGYVNMQTKTPHLGTAHSGTIAYGNSNRARLSADLNWARPDASEGWWGRSAFRLNALWQDGGVPGRDEVQQESRGVAPAVAFGLGTSTRLTLAAQVLRQENLPDYGIPGAAWVDEPLTPTTVQAPAPVDQSNYYGSNSRYDYDRASQDSYTARIEHDLNRQVSMRNQTRYNRTSREAVVSAIQNPAAYNPATNLVTIARQGNERANNILSNQTSLNAGFSTGHLRHSTALGLEYTFEQQFSPTLGGLGTRAPVDIFFPNVDEPVVGYAPARTGAFTKGTTSTVGAYLFDTVDIGARWQVVGSVRVERYDTTYRAVNATGATTTDLDGADVLLSGKAGVVYRLTETGNVYVSYGTTVTPPGSANFALSSQANNQNNPSVEPQESANFEVGTKWDVAANRLSLTGAVFRTRNKNVIYTVDAAAVPPVYNQDDAQLVRGVTVGAMGRVTQWWDVLANFGYLDATFESQSPLTNGNRLTLTPEFSSSVWSTFRLPNGVRLGGGVRHTGDVWVNAANTIRSPGYALVDALAEYEVNAHLTLRLNVYNLFDETYIRNVNNNGGRYNPGYPRSAMVTSQVGF